MKESMTKLYKPIKIPQFPVTEQNASLAQSVRKIHRCDINLDGLS